MTSVRSDWIPTSERLPECGAVVLFVVVREDHDDGGLVCMGSCGGTWMVTSDADTPWFDVESGPYGIAVMYAPGEVSHWMPLPAPPAVGPRPSSIRGR